MYPKTNPDKILFEASKVMRNDAEAKREDVGLNECYSSWFRSDIKALVESATGLTMSDTVIASANHTAVVETTIEYRPMRKDWIGTV